MKALLALLLVAASCIACGVTVEAATGESSGAQRDPVPADCFACEEALLRLGAGTAVPSSALCGPGFAPWVAYQNCFCVDCYAACQNVNGCMIAHPGEQTAACASCVAQQCGEQRALCALDAAGEP